MKTKVDQELYDNIKYDLLIGCGVVGIASARGISPATINRIKNSKNLEDYFKTQRDQRRGYKNKAKKPSYEEAKSVKIAWRKIEWEGEEEAELEQAKAIAVLVKSGFLKVEVNK